MNNNISGSDWRSHSALRIPHPAALTGRTERAMACEACGRSSRKALVRCVGCRRSPRGAVCPPPAVHQLIRTKSPPDAQLGAGLRGWLRRHRAQGSCLVTRSSSAPRASGAAFVPDPAGRHSKAPDLLAARRVCVAAQSSRNRGARRRESIKATLPMLIGEQAEDLHNRCSSTPATDGVHQETNTHGSHGDCFGPGV